MNDKWGRRLFIAGAVMLIVIAAVHSISLFQKPMARNDSEKQLTELMTNYRFTVMGSVCTMNGFLRGFSISFGIASLVFGVLDLTLRREPAALLQRFALVNVMWLAVITGVSWHYFFSVPRSFLPLTMLVFLL